MWYTVIATERETQNIKNSKPEKPGGEVPAAGETKSPPGETAREK
jgi:hypothetical protein